MGTGLISLKRDPYFAKGVAPRQRRVYVLRWNPSISSFTRDDFEKYFAQYKGLKPYNYDDKLDWTVWEWETVMHRDLFVMMQVGQEVSGIVWGGFLGGHPYQYEKEDGTLTSAHFFETTVNFMHRIEKTGILTADRLQAAIPEVDWLHGHSGELISVESAEKLGMFLVDELKNVDDGENMYFDEFSQKPYVLADIMTFMCPKLKTRLKAAGKIGNKRLRNINNLMVRLEDEDYGHWDVIEEHLRLEKLNGILM